MYNQFQNPFAQYEGMYNYNPMQMGDGGGFGGGNAIMHRMAAGLGMNPNHGNGVIPFQNRPNPNAPQNTGIVPPHLQGGPQWNHPVVPFQPRPRGMNTGWMPEPQENPMGGAGGPMPIPRMPHPAGVMGRGQMMRDAENPGAFQWGRF